MSFVFLPIVCAELAFSETETETESLMHWQRISELLAPFLSAPLSDAQLSQFAAYLEILHRWNARMNLTAIHDPEQVVTRHFGESLFAAQHLFPRSPEPEARSLIDIGSGAGFPGLPIKIWCPELPVTLIESQHRKATFLKEVIRALDLHDVSVSPTRAEDFASLEPGAQRPKPVVTLRAVENFDRILPVAARLAAHGRLALLIGAPQVETARRLLPAFQWAEPMPIPLALTRVLLVGESR
jgi:16S rRNA (guanine527-N7)-methyltransferase